MVTRKVDERSYHSRRAAFVVINTVVSLTYLAVSLAFQFARSALYGLSAEAHGITSIWIELTVGPHSQQSLVTPSPSLSFSQRGPLTAV